MQRLLSFLFGVVKVRAIREIILKLILKLDNQKRDFSRRIMKNYYSVEIGKYTYGGCYEIDGRIARNTKIGSFCSIADGVRIGGMNHPTHFVSTHPFLYLKNRGFVCENNDEIFNKGNKAVIIEDDVWIGQNAVILPGIKIGKGAVIGAGAIVTKDIEPYSIAVGVPAKVIKKRFSDDQIKKLKDIDWANWGDDEIKNRLNDFYNVNHFVNS